MKDVFITIHVEGSESKKPITNFDAWKRDLALSDLYQNGNSGLDCRICPAMLSCPLLNKLEFVPEQCKEEFTKWATAYAEE